MPVSHNKLWRFFSQFDFFQIPISLYFKKLKKSSTTIGLFFSLFVYSMLIYNFLQSDLIQKSSPNVVSQSEIHAHAPQIMFDTNRMISVSVCDDNALNYIDPTIFNITFSLKRYKTNKYGSYDFVSNQNKDLKLCNPEDFPFEPNLLNEIGLRNAYCLKSKDFILEGFWDEQEIVFADLELFPCDNLTMNYTCKRTDEINAYFTGKKYFQVYFHGVGVKIDDYLDPVKEKYENFYQMIDNRLFKKLQIFMKNLEVITEDGWLFSHITHQSDIMLDKTIIDTMFRDELQRPCLSEIIFFASHEYFKNSRKYQNLWEIVANLFGMGNFLVYFCFLVTNCKNHIKNLKEILNFLYFFPSEEKLEKSDKLKEKEENTSSPKKRLCNHPKKIPKVISIFPDKTNTSLTKISFDFENFTKQFRGGSSRMKKKLNKNSFSYDECSGTGHKKSSNSLKIGFFEYLLFWFRWILRWRKNSKDILIHKAEKLYEKEMDIMNMLAKLHEIEKIKLILFNDDQLVLFDSLAKPLAFLDHREINNSSYQMATIMNNYKLAKKNEKSFKVSYHRIKSAVKETEINRRLLGLVHNKFDIS